MRRILILLPALLALQVGVSPALAWTWPVDGPVLQTFDVGSDPYEGGRHRGIDVGAPAGASVVAPASGTVSFAGTLPTYGNSVTIETPDGYSVTLVHLGLSSVTAGAAIDEGEQVGVVGPSGEVELAEPYVHLGIRRTSDPNGYVDPLLFLPARGPGPPDGGALADGTGGSEQTQGGAAMAGAGGGEAPSVDSPAATTTLEPPDVPAPEPPVPAEPVAVATEPARGAQDFPPAPATASSTIGTSDPSLGIAPVTPPLGPVDPTPPMEPREPLRPEKPPRQVRQSGRVTSVPYAQPAVHPSSLVRGRPLEHAAPAAQPPTVEQVTRVKRPAPMEHATPAHRAAPARPLPAPVRRSKRGLPPAATEPSGRTHAAAPTTVARSSSVLGGHVPRRLERPPARHAGSRVGARLASPEGQSAGARAGQGPRLQKQSDSGAEGHARDARPPRPDTPQALKPTPAPAAARATSPGSGLSPWLAALLGASSAMLVLLCLRRRRRGARAAALGEPPPTGPDHRHASTERADDAVAEALDRELAQILAQADASRRASISDRRTVAARAASRREPQRE